MQNSQLYGDDGIVSPGNPSKSRASVQPRQTKPDTEVDWQAPVLSFMSQHDSTVTTHRKISAYRYPLRPIITGLVT